MILILKIKEYYMVSKVMEDIIFKMMIIMKLLLWNLPHNIIILKEKQNHALFIYQMEIKMMEINIYLVLEWKAQLQKYIKYKNHTLYLITFLIFILRLL